MEVKINNIGLAIKLLRKEAKLTQTELGLLIGTKKVQISKWENNRNHIQTDSLERIMKALNKTITINIS